MNRSDSASRAARSHHLCVSNGKCRGRVLQKGTLASMHKADTQGWSGVTVLVRRHGRPGLAWLPRGAVRVGAPEFRHLFDVRMQGGEAIKNGFSSQLSCLKSIN